MPKKKEIATTAKGNPIQSLKITNFVRKLYTEACNEANKDIHFDPDGEKLIINKNNFIKNTLSKISTTKDYSGFVRQLNNYGFTKIKVDKKALGEFTNGITEYNDVDVYYHQYFNLLDEKSLCLIQRDTNKTSEIKENMSSLVNSIQYLINCNYKLQKNLELMNEKVKNLERRSQSLYEFMGYAFKQGMSTHMASNNFLPGNEFANEAEQNFITKPNNLALVDKNKKDDKEKKKKTIFDEFYL